MNDRIYKRKIFELLSTPKRMKKLEYLMIVSRESFTFFAKKTRVENLVNEKKLNERKANTQKNNMEEA